MHEFQQMRIFVGIADAQASAVTSSQSPLATHPRAISATPSPAQHTTRNHAKHVLPGSRSLRCLKVREATFGAGYPYPATLYGGGGASIAFPPSEIAILPARAGPPTPCCFEGVRDVHPLLGRGDIKHLPSSFVFVTFRVPRRGDLCCASVCRPRSDGRGLHCQERVVPRREAPASQRCRRAAELADSDCSVLPGQRLRQPCARPSRWAERELKHAQGRRCNLQRSIRRDSDAAALVLTRPEISDRRDAHVAASHGRRATCTCTRFSRNLQQMRIFVGIPDAQASAVTSSQLPLATRSQPTSVTPSRRCTPRVTMPPSTYTLPGTRSLRCLS